MEKQLLKAQRHSRIFFILFALVFLLEGYHTFMSPSHKPNIIPFVLLGVIYLSEEIQKGVLQIIMEIRKKNDQVS